MVCTLLAWKCSCLAQWDGQVPEKVLSLHWVCRQCGMRSLGGSAHPVLLLSLFFPTESRKKSAHGSGHSVISVLQGLLLCLVGLGRAEQ